MSAQLSSTFGHLHYILIYKHNSYEPSSSSSKNLRALKIFTRSHFEYLEKESARLS